ncbi:MAG: DNA polymerase IV [Prevotellaceae bacterium]|jgi:DNA polymerase-4|nr:DNA polymerase IV [Prevotellaceae bacterium]
MPQIRKIIHVDMDAFYASIEQRDHPEYKNKPLAVGYSGNRGVVAAASYEARKYGVKSAMPSKTALKRCPHIIFVPARFDVYKSVSMELHRIFSEYTDLIEPLSLDEAFLDVTENKKQQPSAMLIAKEIKQRIYEQTALTASAGVSYNKFLAKTASDQNKPNGIFVIEPKNAIPFLEQLPIERFFGVGKVTAEKMHRLGIFTGLELKQKTEQQLTACFGKAGHIYYQNVRGIDHRPVEANRIRKSVGAENTFESDIDSPDELDVILQNLSDEVFDRIKRNGFVGRTVTVKIKYTDFRIITRSKTLETPVENATMIYQTARNLLFSVDLAHAIRLLGVSVKKQDIIEWKDALQLEINFDV